MNSVLHITEVIKGGIASYIDELYLYHNKNDSIKKNLLINFHPETLHKGEAKSQVKELIKVGDFQFCVYDHNKKAIATKKIA